MASRRVCGRLGRGRHGFAGCGMGKATEIPGLSGGRTGSPRGNLRKASAPAAENAPLFSGAPRWKMPSGILSRGALLPVQRSARCFPVGKRSTISRPHATAPRAALCRRPAPEKRAPHARHRGKRHPASFRVGHPCLCDAIRAVFLLESAPPFPARTRRPSRTAPHHFPPTRDSPPRSAPQTPRAGKARPACAPQGKMPAGILSRRAPLPVRRNPRCFPVGKRSTISRPRAVPPAQRSADASRWKSAPRLPHAHRAGKALAGVVARRLANESVQPEFSTAWTDRLALRESRRCGDQRCGAASKPRLPPRTRVDKASALCAAARAVSRFRSNVSMDRPGRIRRLPHYGKQRQRRERCSPMRRPQSDRAEARKARAPSLWKRSLRRRQHPGDGTGRRRGAMLFCR